MENSAENQKVHDEQTQQVPADVAPQTIFLNLAENTPSEEIESLCMNCEKQGKTKFLFTKIPFFKEIILSSFECEHCGLRNNEVQFGGKIADFGIRYELKLVNAINMNRSIVKSEHATIKIPELDLEIPPETQKGTINTVEGFLQKTIEGLNDLQEQRRAVYPETAAKIDEFIQKITEFMEGKRFPFNLILEDPSGNSFIQNPNAPNKDVYMKTEWYPRTPEDYVTMGYNEDASAMQADEDRKKFEADKPNNEKKLKVKKGQTEEEQKELLERFKAYGMREARGGDPEITAQNMDFTKSMDDQVQQPDSVEEDVRKEVMKFQTYCYACNREGNAQMCISHIPFFKEIIIMAFSCEFCGYRNTEIKNGGGISEKATRIVLKVEKPEDLNRDVFKSDTCVMAIPEVDFALAPGTLGSVYTTVEGLLDKVITNLTDNNPFGMGDSATNTKYLEFITRMQGLKDFKEPFTLILDDAISNCFVYNPFAPEADPQIEVTVYERTWEQNEELGLNDMEV